MAESYSVEALTERATRYFDRPSFSCPTWLSDHEIVFLDDRTGTKQASMVDVSSGEITQITLFTERLLNVAASRTTSAVVYGIDNGGNERQQLFVMPQIGESPIRLTHDDEAIHDPGPLTTDGSYLLYRTNARDHSVFDVMGVSTNGGDPEVWLQDGGQVQPIAVSKDGTTAVVSRLNGNLDGDLLLVKKGEEAINLTPHDGEQWVSSAEFSGGGEFLWYLSNEGNEYISLRRMDISSREVEVVFAAVGWDVELFSVSGNEQHIAVSVNANGQSQMYLTDISGHIETPVDLPAGVIDQFSWNSDSTRVAFGFSTVEAPSAILVADLSGDVIPVAQVPETAPATYAPEAITYTTFDGRLIPAFFFKPDGDGPFPVLVDIHGGPEGQRQLNYSPSGPVLQYLTSLGMAVLTLNVRGSTGYGKSYSHLDDKGLRLDSVADVAHAVAWLKQRDDIDVERIAVYGRSYGGFMTLASLVFYPDLWAAGVDVVGIANFVSFLERTGPWRRKHREAEYGELENDREMLERISPLTHIDNIAAPLMVCHGRNDPRVPLFEAEQVVEAVQAKGLDVVLRVYDDEGHALSKRKNEIDAFVTMGLFLQKHLQLPVMPDLCC